MLCHIMLERNGIMSKILVETSARHVHVTSEALEISSEKGMSLLPKNAFPARTVCLRGESGRGRTQEYYQRCIHLRPGTPG